MGTTTYGSERTWATALAWCSRSPAPDNKSTASSSDCIFGLNAHCTVGYRRLRLVLVHLHLLGQALSSPGGDVSRTCRSTPAAGPARTYPCRRWGCCSMAMTLHVRGALAIVVPCQRGSSHCCPLSEGIKPWLSLVREALAVVVPCQRGSYHICPFVTMIYP